MQRWPIPGYDADDEYDSIEFSGRTSTREDWRLPIRPGDPDHRSHSMETMAGRLSPGFRRRCYRPFQAPPPERTARFMRNHNLGSNIQGGSNYDV
jgi:hypothetical protein